MGREKADRVARFDDEGLLLGHGPEVRLQQAVLHPVLAHLACLAVGDQFIGIEGHVEIEVVVDHDLAGPALDAIAGVRINGVSLDRPRRPEPVGIDPAHREKLVEKLGGEPAVPALGHVTQGVLEGEDGLGPAQGELPLRRPSYPLDKRGRGGKTLDHCIQSDSHSLGDSLIAQHILPPWETTPAYQILSLRRPDLSRQIETLPRMLFTQPSHKPCACTLTFIYYLLRPSRKWRKGLSEAPGLAGDVVS